MRKLLTLAGLGAAAALLAAAAGHGSVSQRTATPQKVSVAASEFAFVVRPKIVAKGVVVFTVANKGAISHDFKIAGKKTALIAAGTRRTLRITFSKKGRYPYLCTLPSHAAAGMKGVVVVR